MKQLAVAALTALASAAAYARAGQFRVDGHRRRRSSRGGDPESPQVNSNCHPHRRQGGKVRAQLGGSMNSLLAAIATALASANAVAGFTPVNNVAEPGSFELLAIAGVVAAVVALRNRRK
jgi:hypothetical protein